MVDVVACVRTIAGSLASSLSLVLGGLALAWLVTPGASLSVVRSGGRRSRIASWPRSTAPLRSLLCISRT